ncbi:unnamed protein product [Owenia fusiformis]|uniref:Uncharacterized protein n=1 Tax=Owenia fusiformis TaxID=6347 RepID=A0A8J1TWR4_OWEFU|nr:unnamed protein product [Owenia fusiformis]
MAILCILGLALCATFALGEEVCYGALGCFNDNPPFDDRELPQSPSQINYKFELFTRNNPDTKEDITPENPGRNFRASRRTMFIIHGYLTSTDFEWIANMRRQLLQNGDYNVIKLDWTNGASPDIPGLDYPQAASNTRVVGAAAAQLMYAYMQNSAIGVNIANVHCIGHSLGAQTCGYMGKWLAARNQRLGRISGLDPAGPWFADTTPAVRLTERDATFVDVIHSNGRGAVVLLGIGTPSGHVDFYPNGGGAQPGCGLTYNVHDNRAKRQDVDAWVACSHARAYMYFTESINSGCQFTSNPCQDIDDGEDGFCDRCVPGSSCQFMGWKSTNSPGRGKFYLDTYEDAPFCRN